MNDQLLTMFLIGDLTVKWPAQINGAAITKQELSLLIYLVCQGRAQSREHLCDLLWEDRPLSQARSNLRTLLTRSRLTLGPLLHIERESVAFNFEYPHWVDVLEFRQQINLQRGGHSAVNGEAANRRLAKTLQLYHGDFLANFIAKYSTRFEQWVMQEQLTLRQQAIKAMQTVIHFHLTQGEYGSGLTWANRLLEMDPHNERARAHTMQLLVGNRQLDLALLHYETYRQQLELEFGETPGLEMRTVYEAIKAGDLRQLLSYHVSTQLSANTILVSPPSAVGSISATRPPLPVPTVPLVGRTAVMAQLRRLLRQPGQRLITLTGLAGSGKTHLALTIAAELQSEFADGVVYAALPFASDSLQQGQQALWQTVTAALGLHFPATQEGVLAGVQGKELLLIIDNVDRILPEAGLLQMLAEQTSEVTILAIARQSLRLHRETVLPLDGLLEGSADHLWQLATYQAASEEDRTAYFAPIHLFLQRMRRYWVEVELTEDLIYQIVRICRLVDGHPLAIELAAAWSPHYTVAETADAVERDLGFLQNQQGEFPRHHASMMGLFVEAWQQLTAEQQLVLCRLSVFVGSFSREAAVEIAQTTPVLLAGLVNQSLLKLKGVGRYELSSLICRFVAEQWAVCAVNALEDRQQTIARYCNYYMAIASSHEVLACKGSSMILHKLINELANIRAAWQYRGSIGIQPLVNPLLLDHLASKS